MAKQKRRRFRLQNIKRLLCCCCPFGKKRYSLDECDDGEDDLRGRFTPTWRITSIALSNTLDEGLYRESTVSQQKPDGRDEGQCVPLQVTSAVKCDSLLQETELTRENAALQLIEPQMLENYSFQIIQSQRPEHASIQTTTIQRWVEAAFQIPLNHARGPLSHTAICMLPANNETMVYQNRMSSRKHIQEHVGLYVWSRSSQAVDKLHRCLPGPMFAERISLLHRRQDDVYSHGRAVLVSFLHLLRQGTYYYERRIQTFRNHCIINYQSLFLPIYPDLFYFIFRSGIYTIINSSMSFQVLAPLEYHDRCHGNVDSISDDENVNDDNMSDVDDDETNDHDVIQQGTDGSTCENKADNSGAFSVIAGNNTFTKKELVIVYTSLDFQNGLIKNSVQKKCGPNKNCGIPKYCDSVMRLQDSNNQTSARSKQNGRVRVKATLSAASDPPPDYLKQQVQICSRYFIAERSMLKSPSVLSRWRINHHYLQSTSSLNFQKYRSCFRNNYQSIRILCHRHFIVAILSVGVIILVYLAYMLIR